MYELGDAKDKQFIVTGFHHIVVCTCFVAAQQLVVAIEGGQHDNWNIPQCLVCPQFLYNLKAIDVWQHHIAEDEVGLPLLDATDGRLTVGVADCLEKASDAVTYLVEHIRIILYDGNGQVVEGLRY